MPRGARQQSESMIYHVMVRGINQVQLFYDDEDRAAFVERLRRYRDECGFRLLAWCLMGNHVHLLVEIGNVDLPTIMKKLLLSYAYWYNIKYDRSGYLYQDRYVSKAVDKDQYLLAAVRYIHRNPLEAGNPVDYWTSYKDYVCDGGVGITDTELVLGMLSDDADRARGFFVKLVTGEDAPCVYEFDARPSRTRDSHAIAIIKKVAGVESCGDVCLLDAASRSAVLAELRARGLSIRQIARRTGLNRGVVERAGSVSREPSP